VEGTFKRDLPSFPLENLDWAPEKRRESVEKIFQYVSAHALQAMRWYLIKKNSKRFWARFLRVGAILLTALAGLLPLLAQIYQNNPKISIEPAWASVALLIAATFVGLDHFFGFSNSWMRFITAALRIKTEYEAFQLDWQMQLISSDGQTLSEEQTLTLLNVCKKFLQTVNEIVVDEMEQWRQHFKAVLKKIDAQAVSLKK